MRGEFQAADGRSAVFGEQWGHGGLALVKEWVEWAVDSVGGSHW